MIAEPPSYRDRHHGTDGHEPAVVLRRTAAHPRSLRLGHSPLSRPALSEYLFYTGHSSGRITVPDEGRQHDPTAAPPAFRHPSGGLLPFLAIGISPVAFVLSKERTMSTATTVQDRHLKVVWTPQDAQEARQVLHHEEQRCGAFLSAKKFPAV